MLFSKELPALKFQYVKLISPNKKELGPNLFEEKSLRNWIETQAYRFSFVVKGNEIKMAVVFVYDPVDFSMIQNVRGKRV